MPRMNNQTLTIAQEFEAKNRAETKNEKFMRWAPSLVLIGMILFFIATCQKNFLSLDNLSTILNQMAIPLLIAIGLTFVIMLGCIDLSIDGVVGLAASLLSIFVLNDKNTNNMGILGVLLPIAVCMIIGLLIGVSYVKLKIPTFMVSFCFMFIAQGIAMLSYGGIPATIKDPVLVAIPKQSFLGLPVITWISLAVLALAYFIQEYTALGRYIYAIGTSERVPKMAGVNVDRVKIIVFVFATFCSGVAGVLGGIRLGQGQVSVGTGMMFPAQAAVVVGGTALTGGKGGVINTLVGVAIMTVLDNGLLLMGVNPDIENAIQGVIILLAVVLTVKHSDKEICK